MYEDLRKQATDTTKANMVSKTLTSMMEKLQRWIITIQGYSLFSNKTVCKGIEILKKKAKRMKQNY
jgi:hypothetical protein